MIVMPTIPLRNKNAGMVYQHVHFRDGECDKITASARPSSIRDCPQSRQWLSERQRLRAAASVPPDRIFARRRRSHAPRAVRVSSGARPSRRIQSLSSLMATTRVISTA